MNGIVLGAGNPRPDCHYGHFYRLPVAGTPGWIGCYNQHLPAILFISDRGIAILRQVAGFALFQQSHRRRAVLIRGIAFYRHLPVCRECSMELPTPFAFRRGAGRSSVKSGTFLGVVGIGLIISVILFF